MAEVLLLPADDATRATVAMAVRAAGHRLHVLPAGAPLDESRDPPDLVLADALRVGELLRQTIRVSSPAPLIVLDGRGDDDAIIAAVTAGAVGFLAHPFTARDAAEIVERTLAASLADHERGRELLEHAAQIYGSLRPLRDVASKRIRG